MPSDSSSTKGDLPRLAADGCLITAGTFGLMIGLAFGLEALGVTPLGEPQGSGVDLALSIVSWLLQVGGFVAGPLLAWWLHRRGFNKVTILALILAFPVGAALVVPAAILGAFFFDWFVGLFTSTQYAGVIGYLVVVALAFLALLVWLDVDAVRDLARSRRKHVPLDAGRLAASVAVAVFAAVVIAVTLAGEDALEAGVFLLAAGVQGAAVVTAADLIARLVRSRSVSQESAAGT